MKKAILTFGVITFYFMLSSCSSTSNETKSEVVKSNPEESAIRDELDDADKSTKSYATITIGQQEWMAYDINTTVYNNGDPINEAKTEKQWRQYGSKNLGCFRKLTNGTYLYNGFAVNDKRGIIPLRFSLPTYDEFNRLFKFLGGGDSQSGKATKSLVTYPLYVEEWVDDQENGGLETVEIKTNGDSGFNARPGGYVYDHGFVGHEGSCSYWWTASSEGKNKIVVDVGYCSQDLGGGKGNYPATFGFAVRAIKR
jgi:uncharacterized protein (TIGR02145 family)